MELEGDTGSMGAVDAGGLRRTALVPMEGSLSFLLWLWEAMEEFSARLTPLP